MLSFALISGLTAVRLATTLLVTPPEGFVVDTVGGAFSEVVGVQALPDGRLVAWERSGLVWMIGADGVRLPAPVIDIREEVGAWRDFGLLGLAVHPNFPAEPTLFLAYVVDRHHLMNFGTAGYSPTTSDYYSATIGRVTRYSLDPAADHAAVVPGSRRVLLGETATTGVPILHQSHGIGTLQFGQDGTLLLSTGDSASYATVDLGGQVSGGWMTQALADGIVAAREDVGAFRSQLVDSLCGKLLRIDPETGDGVPSNPWFDAAAPRSARSRVFSLGLRNPYRMTMLQGSGSHDPADADPGQFLVGDVGWGGYEEVSVIDGPGLNLGWPVFEGLGYQSGYALAPTANPDSAVGACAPMPFRELLREDSAAPPSFVRACAVLQAEGATASGVAFASTNHGFTGSGYRDYPDSTGAWVEWAVTVAAEGDHRIALRYANGASSDRPLALRVDGVTVQASLSLPSTGSWTDWRVARSVPVRLAAGAHVVRLESTSSMGPNLDAAWVDDGTDVAIPASVPVFTHRRPVIDWKQSAAVARTPGLNAAGAATAVPVGGTGGATGSGFSGRCAIGGPRVDFPAWPPEYRGAMFFADYDQGWLRAAFTSKEGSCGRSGADCRCHLRVTGVKPFDESLGPVVGVFADPVGQALYVTKWTGILRYRWLPSGSLPPVAAFAASASFGPSPLAVTFDASASSDPEGAPLSYEWSFGDGSRGAAGATVSHTFSAAGAAGFDVTLTVRDPGGASSSLSRRVAVNDTPPVARIASIVDGQLYSMERESAFVLRAEVADQESGATGTECEWRVTLHHDSHSHPEPVAFGCTVQATISPIGCAPPSEYWYEVSLLVRDQSGLTASDSVRLEPDCGGLLRCFGDLDGDGHVGGGDLAELLSNWNGGGPSDLDGNGIVLGGDLAEVLSHWGECPP